MMSENWVHNSGIAYGLLPQIPVYLVVGVLIVLIFYAVKMRELIERIALLLLIVGGTGNVYMRIRYGSVIDNLNFFGLFYNNIWDYLIGVGVVIYVINLFRQKI